MSASPMTTATSIDPPVVFLSKQINRIYIAPKSQSRRFTISTVNDIRCPQTPDTSEEKLAMFGTEREDEKTNKQSNIKF